MSSTFDRRLRRVEEAVRFTGSCEIVILGPGEVEPPPSDSVARIVVAGIDVPGCATPAPFVKPERL